MFTTHLPLQALGRIGRTQAEPELKKVHRCGPSQNAPGTPCPRMQHLGGQQEAQQVSAQEVPSSAKRETVRGRMIFTCSVLISP